MPAENDSIRANTTRPKTQSLFLDAAHRALILITLLLELRNQEARICNGGHLPRVVWPVALPRHSPSKQLPVTQIQPTSAKTLEQIGENISQTYSHVKKFRQQKFRQQKFRPQKFRPHVKPVEIAPRWQ